MPLISIITPVYNGAKTLKRCISSVLKQSMADWEWIILNDCSTDSTSSIIASAAEIDRRIKILTNHENKGLALCRYIASSICTGDYIVFIDADDTLEKNALAVIAKAVNNYNADIYVIGSKINFRKIGYSHKFYHPGRDTTFNNGPISGTEAINNILRGNGLIPNVWDKIYKRELIDKISIIDRPITVGEDLIFNLKVFQHAKLVMPIYDYGYKWSSDGMRDKYYIDQWEQYVEAIEYAQDIINAQYHSQNDRQHLYLNVAYNYIICLQESVVQRLLLKQRKEMILEFIDKALQNTVLKYLNLWNDTPVTSLSATKILELARLHLRNHRKYYTFTRVLNWLS